MYNFVNLICVFLLLLVKFTIYESSMKGREYLMHFPITTVSVYAENVLRKHTCGTVHSIYHKTINLQFGGHLLALQTAASPFSPVSLITELDVESMQSLKLEIGQTAVYQGGCIIITASEFAYIFTLAGAVTIDLELTPSLHSVDKACIGEALERSHGGGFGSIFQSAPHRTERNTAGNQDLILSAARQKMYRCTQLFQQGDYVPAAQELSRLLGLGLGLTPSGDDFLCGVFAGLTLCGQHCHPFTRALRDTVHSHLSDTNDISGTFLTCALHSQYSQAVLSLSPASSPEDICGAFEAIGHSSGIDTLCGIYYGISLFP